MGGDGGSRTTSVPRSGGILLHRGDAGHLEVLLAHLGGPFFARRDAGAWTAPKGLVEPGEDVLAAARREFAEELGLPVPDGVPRHLGEQVQPRGKVVELWALEGDLDVAAVVPGLFEMEWPRGSGRLRSFPEVDRAQWFDLRTAHAKVVRGQAVFLDRLAQLLGAGPVPGR